ncbi:protein kinase domain-containing protein [Micromonospora sp. KLBMP9576]|uniref:serine/threonine-protein kinase n=1 Tax=Micromonospora sp. KLBMP9576 TaxID=3424769 RepID=UPI003D8ADAF1
MLTHGLVLSDRYRLDDRVATGGMGAVWRCTDLMLERRVAVKVLLPALSVDPEFTGRFRAEARMLAALRHPGVVAVHDVGRAVLADGNQVDYLVMEYVEGRPLSAWLRRAGRLDPTSTMSVVAQAAEALHAAHLAGIVHRDVKPGNLLVKTDGRLVLVDFGIARSGTTAGITGVNVVLGTASYMSPEQAANQRVSPATDVYALGAVAYSCLAGQPPFDGDNPLQVALRHVQDEPPPLPSDIPPAVAALVRRAMAKRPGDRFPDAAALADAAAEARDATLAVAPRSARPPWSVAGPGALPDLWAPLPPVDPAAAGPVPGAGRPMPAPSTAPAAVLPAFADASTPTAMPHAVGPLGGPGPDPAGGTVASVPSTRRDPGAPPPSRRRRGALVGAAATVFAVLAGVVGAVAVFSGGDRPAGGNVPAALAGEPAASDPPGAAVDDGSGELRVAPSRGPSRSPAASASTSATASASPPGGAPAPPPGGGGPTATAPGPPGSTPTSRPPAKPNPYTPVEACGSGYQVIDSAALTASGTRRGRVYLLYHAGNGNNCVVTMKETSVGTATAATAWLEVRGRARGTDRGSFSYYAGPVRARAAGVCVRWGGSTGGASYASGFEHCG